MLHLNKSLIAAVLILSGCATVPKMASLPGPADQLKLSLSSPAAAGWWSRYDDPQLDRLVAMALADSPTLALATARLQAANARADQSLAATLPALNANSQVSSTKQSYNAGFPKLFVPKGYKEFGRGSLDLAYDLDLWGRNRAGLAAATSEAEALKADAELAKLILTTSLVSAYADYARTEAEAKAAENLVRNRQAMADLAAQQNANGLINRGEAQQTAAAAALAQGEAEGAREQLIATRNRIAALVGADPRLGLTLAPPTARTLGRPGLPDHLSIDLIGHRPDVRAARLRTEAAARRIDVARAGFYPNLNLAAYTGRYALGLDMLTHQGSDIGQAGLAFSLPIFEGGKLRAGYRGARAEYEASVATYNQTLVQALKEVADAMADKAAVTAQLAAARRALAASETALEITRQRFEGGLASYLLPLNAEGTVIAQRRVVAQLEARTLMADAGLVRALGGDFRN